MSPNGGGIPNENVYNILKKNFESFNKFKSNFNENAKWHYGSGWTWLV